MIKNAPEGAQEFLLKVINKFWNEGYFCEKWRLKTVVPIPKLGKNHSYPNNFRPLSLTSCFCKVDEKLVSNRLVEYLEKGKYLAKIRCGFRKNRSTLDHQVRLNTYIRKGMTANRGVTAIMFDLEKAYDLAWRYGILYDLYEIRLRGRLPAFVKTFLQDRYFQVRISDQLSINECRG